MSKILIAEDNDSNMKLMFDILTANGFSVDKANDGEDALEKIKQNDYDLLVLDIQMPKKSGYDVLKEMTKKVNVLVVSACAMEKDISLAQNIGCLDYITKPIKVFSFLEKVKTILNN